MYDVCVWWRCNYVSWVTGVIIQRIMGCESDGVSDGDNLIRCKNVSDYGGCRGGRVSDYGCWYDDV
jgi:hypothetical protein